MAQHAEGAGLSLPPSYLNHTVFHFGIKEVLSDFGVYLQMQSSIHFVVVTVRARFLGH